MNCSIQNPFCVVNTGSEYRHSAPFVTILSRICIILMTTTLCLVMPAHRSASADTRPPHTQLYIFTVNEKYGAMLPDGEVVIAPNLDYLSSSFSREGITYGSVNGKCGYIKANGQWLIPPRFEGCSSYNPEGSIVSDKGKFGMIDKNGKWLIQPRFDSSFYFQKLSDKYPDVAIVTRNKHEGIIDRKGRVILDFKHESIRKCKDGVLWVQGGPDRNGYTNITGSYLSAQDYIDGCPFTFAPNGLARIWFKNSRVISYVNKKGRYYFHGRFDYHYDFEANGLARVTVKGKMGLIDSKGNWVRKPDCYDIAQFDDSPLAYAKKESDGSYGYLNVKGEWLIEPCFEDVNSFSDGLAWVKYNGKYGAFDVTGAWVVRPIYEERSSFASGLWKVRKKNKYGVIDYTGNTILECKYDGLSSLSEGMAAAKLDAVYGYINKEGEWLIAPGFEEAKDFSKALAAVKINGKFGYVNPQGEIVIPPRFDEAESFSEHFAVVKKDGSRGYVSRGNRVLYEGIVCGEGALQNERFYTVWPSVEELQARCGQGHDGGALRQRY